MANFNENVETAITIVENSTGKSVLSVIEARVMKVLRHESIGIHMKATAEQGSGIVKGGTVWFRKGTLFQVTDYDNTGAAKQTPAVDRVSVLVDTPKEIHYEIETLDMERYSTTMGGEQIANAIIASWADGAASAIAAFLDTVYIAQVITSATNAKNVFTLPSVTSDITTAGTRDKAFAEGVGTITNAHKAIIKTINKNAIGVSRSEIYGILDVAFKNLLIGGSGVVGSNQSLENLTENTLGTKEGGDGVARFGGVDWYTSILLDQPATAFTVFAKGSTVDFSNVAGIIAHRQAIGLPTTTIQSTMTPNPNNGNPVFVHKFVYGVGAVRPELTAVIKYFVKAPPSHN